MRAGVISPQDGCQKRQSDQEKGVSLQIEDGNLRDQSNFMVFFKDEECDPAQMLGQTDFGCSDKAGAADWNSFEVWDMCEDNPMCDFGVGPPASEIPELAELSETDNSTLDEGPDEVPDTDSQTSIPTASPTLDPAISVIGWTEVPNTNIQRSIPTASAE
jgi:hypothetical protein